MTVNKLIAVIKQVFAVSRPFSWINTAAPYAAGHLLATGKIDLSFWIGIAYFLWPYNLAMYGINDIYDYESDIKNPRKGSIEGSIVAPQQRKQLWYAIAAFNLPFLAYFVWQGSPTSNIIIVLVSFLCVSYSIKGLRFKEVPFLDSINSALHFVGPMVFGLAFGGAKSYPLALLVAFTFWGMASQAFGAIQDIAPDRAGGIKSIATHLGTRRTANYALALYLACSIIVAAFYWPLGVVCGILLGLYALNVTFFRKYKSDAKAHVYRRGWKNFLWLNWLVGFWLTQIILFATDPFSLGATRFDVVAYSLIGLGLLQLLLSAYNLFSLRRPKTNSVISEPPKVSVLIHALNQGSNISSTLLALLGQSYPDIEVLFTDLGSDDNTLKLAQGFQDERLRILDINDPESGWEASAWAAEQLLAHAEGEVVVLLSADTILMPNALATIVSLMEKQSLQLVSLLPADQNKTLAQKLILNQNHFLLLGCYPAGLVEKKHPSINLAYSGLIGMNRTALHKIGGFKSSRKSPIAEMELARQASLAGLKTSFYLASDVATSQNHATFETITHDNVQRYYPALQFNMPLTVSAITLGAFLFVTPGIGLLASAIYSPQSITLWAAAYCAGLAPRIMISSTSKQGFLGALFYPATSLISLTALAFSMLSYELFRPRWQKRTELR